MKALLNDIVEALQFLTDEHYNFFDRQTGQVELVSREALAIAEEEGTGEDVLESEDHEFAIAQAIFADWDRFEKLPTKYDVNEWEIMRDFAESVAPERFANDLQNAIRGSGAFRYFKDTLRHYRRENDWYAFRDEALRQIAIDWCKENSIEYTDRRTQAAES